MTKKSSTPAIRFKGFTDTWEQRKLGDVVQITMGQSPDGSTYSDEPSDYILVQGNADLQNGWVCPRIWTTQITKKADAGDLIMSVRAPAGAMGKTAYNAVIGRGVAAIKGNEFIYQLLVKMDADGFWKTLSCGSTFESLNSDNIKNAEVKIPSTAEQIKIGGYFQQLDNLITLHQRKYDKLTNVKKSMLEKMFPKNGSNVPEIRFKGFTEAWEQRELWELTIWDKKFNEVEAEKQPKIIKYPYVLADVFSKIEDASGDVRLLSTGNYIGYTTDEKAGKNLCVGEVVAIPWGGVPNIKYYKGKFVTADNRIATSNDTETLGNRFLSLYLEHSLAFLQSIYRGASIKHPSMNDVLSMQISIPHIQEQREIETWFANLDNLITLHQRELEKLKNLKKACLEKMFV